MNLSSKKRMAAELMKVGVNRVKIRPGDEENVDEAITKSSIRGLISSGSIFHIPEKGISRGRHRAKSNKRNAGSRKGKKGARLSKKEAWMLKVRSQRKHLKIMKDRGEITSSTRRTLYMQIKGGMIRNVKHLRDLASRKD